MPIHVVVKVSPDTHEVVWTCGHVHHTRTAAELCCEDVNSYRFPGQLPAEVRIVDAERPATLMLAPGTQRRLRREREIARRQEEVQRLLRRYRVIDWVLYIPRIVFNVFSWCALLLLGPLIALLEVLSGMAKHGPFDDS